jgi:hypothetical protein
LTKSAKRDIIILICVSRKNDKKTTKGYNYLYMNLGRIRRALQFKYLLLLLVMALAFYIAFIPHQADPYPVHLDEWIHIASSNQIINQGTLTGLVDPFTGGAPIFNQTVEAGFHVFWGIFHQISGISWNDISRYFPGVIFVITILAVYILANRYGFGLEAAFFTTLIVTTVGVLGPGFLVPVAMGLLFISLSLYLVFSYQTWWSYLFLFIFMLFMISMHSVTALILIIILIPYILLNVVKHFRHSLGIAMALGLPFLIGIVLFPQVFQNLISSIFTLLLNPQLPSPYIQLIMIIPAYGHLPIIFCLLGSAVLVFRGGKKNYGLVLGLLLLLLVLAIFYTFHYGNRFIYHRGLIYAMLLMSIIAGAGLNWLRNNKLTAWLAARPRAGFFTRNTGNILCLVLVGFTLAIAIPARLNTPYYHMIDREDFESFVWIKENVDSSYEKAVLDPWKGAAFTVVSGRYVHGWTKDHPYGPEMEAYAFLQNNCEDTAFLIDNGISIVYTRGECRNPDLVEVRDNIYLLMEDGDTNTPDS